MHVDRVQKTIVDVVTYLPADAPLGMQHSHAFLYHPALLDQVISEFELVLIRLAQIVRRRSDNQLHVGVWNVGKELETVPLV